MDKFTNRALCANYRQAVKSPSFWLGRVVAKTPEGKTVDRSKTFESYWRCKGYVDEMNLHFVDCSCIVVSSGCYACVSFSSSRISDRGQA